MVFSSVHVDFPFVPMGAMFAAFCDLGESLRKYDKSNFKVEDKE